MIESYYLLDKEQKKTVTYLQIAIDLTKEGKKPDVILKINNEKWALDVVYSIDDRFWKSFNSKIDKYSHEFRDRVIPVVIQHNIEIFHKSVKLIQEKLPELNLCARNLCARQLFIHLQHLKRERLKNAQGR